MNVKGTDNINRFFFDLVFQIVDAVILPVADVYFIPPVDDMATPAGELSLEVVPPAGYRRHGQQNHHEAHTDKEEALLFIFFKMSFVYWF